MQRNIGTLLLVFFLVLVIAAASVFILRGTPAAKDDPADKPAVTVAPPRETDAATPSGNADPGSLPDGTPVPQMTPDPITGPMSGPTTTAPTPKPTAEPTPEPTAAPTPVPADVTGSFSSDTGTGLNLRVDWRTFTNQEGKRRLRVDVSVVSYSIFASAQSGSISLRAGGKSWSADFAGVQYDGADRIVTPAADFEVDAPASGSPISVAWAYGGTYSGKDLDVIIAKGTVQ